MPSKKSARKRARKLIAAPKPAKSVLSSLNSATYFRKRSREATEYPAMSNAFKNYSRLSLRASKSKPGLPFPDRKKR